jgi:hypothetical protein
MKIKLKHVILAVAILALLPAAVFSSGLDVNSIVDVTAPLGSATLEPGQSENITINLSVTGNQVGTATFKVYRNWTLSGGAFTGSNPATFTVGPRAASDPANTFSTTGIVTVAAGQADGTFTLEVEPFDITNTNSTGAKLELGEGTQATYQVTVPAPASADTTPPVITMAADTTVTATSSAGRAVSFSCSAVDDVDGPVTPVCAPASGSTFALGTTTVNCSATDAAGNTANGTHRVTVVYAWSGILQPINSDGSSIFKLGSTVPLKFKLTGDSAGIDDAVARISLAKISNGIEGTEVEGVSTSGATSGNLFRYDATNDQYIFNLGTKSLTVGTYRVKINLGDGQTRTLQFSLR